MKYEVKIKQTVVREMTIEVEADTAVKAMDKADTVLVQPNMLPAATTTYSKWTVSSVKKKSNETI